MVKKHWSIYKVNNFLVFNILFSLLLAVLPGASSASEVCSGIFEDVSRSEINLDKEIEVFNSWGEIVRRAPDYDKGRKQRAGLSDDINQMGLAEKMIKLSNNVYEPVQTLVSSVRLERRLIGLDEYFKTREMVLNELLKQPLTELKEPIFLPSIYENILSLKALHSKIDPVEYNKHQEAFRKKEESENKEEDQDSKAEDQSQSKDENQSGNQKSPEGMRESHMEEYRDEINDLLMEPGGGEVLHLVGIESAVSKLSNPKVKGFINSLFENIHDDKLTPDHSLRVNIDPVIRKTGENYQKGFILPEPSAKLTEISLFTTQNKEIVTGDYGSFTIKKISELYYKAFAKTGHFDKRIDFDVVDAKNIPLDPARIQLLSEKSRIKDSEWPQEISEIFNIVKASRVGEYEKLEYLAEWFTTTEFFTYGTAKEVGGKETLEASINKLESLRQVMHPALALAKTGVMNCDGASRLFAVLVRDYLGLPTRVSGGRPATGYKIGSTEKEPMLVSDSNAVPHAWVQVYVSGRWVDFEVTPEQRKKDDKKEDSQSQDNRLENFDEAKDKEEQRQTKEESQEKSKDQEAEQSSENQESTKSESGGQSSESSKNDRSSERIDSRSKDDFSDSVRKQNKSSEQAEENSKGNSLSKKELEKAREELEKKIEEFKEQRKKEAEERSSKAAEKKASESSKEENGESNANDSKANKKEDENSRKNSEGDAQSKETSEAESGKESKDSESKSKDNENNNNNNEKNSSESKSEAKEGKEKKDQTRDFNEKNNITKMEDIPDTLEGVFLGESVANVLRAYIHKNSRQETMQKIVTVVNSLGFTLKGVGVKIKQETQIELEAMYQNKDASIKELFENFSVQKVKKQEDLVSLALHLRKVLGLIGRYSKLTAEEQKLYTEINEFIKTAKQNRNANSSQIEAVERIFRDSAGDISRELLKKMFGEDVVVPGSPEMLEMSRSLMSNKLYGFVRSALVSKHFDFVLNSESIPVEKFEKTLMRFHQEQNNNRGTVFAQLNDIGRIANWKWELEMDPDPIIMFLGKLFKGEQKMDFFREQEVVYGAEKVAKRRFSALYYDVSGSMGFQGRSEVQASAIVAYVDKALSEKDGFGKPVHQVYLYPFGDNVKTDRGIEIRTVEEAVNVISSFVSGKTDSGTTTKIQTTFDHFFDMIHEVKNDASTNKEHPLHGFERANMVLMTDGVDSSLNLKKVQERIKDLPEEFKVLLNLISIGEHNRELADFAEGTNSENSRSTHHFFDSKKIEEFLYEGENFKIEKDAFRSSEGNRDWIYDSNLDSIVFREPSISDLSNHYQALRSKIKVDPEAEIYEGSTQNLMFLKDIKRDYPAELFTKEERMAVGVKILENYPRLMGKNLDALALGESNLLKYLDSWIVE